MRATRPVAIAALIAAAAAAGGALAAPGPDDARDYDLSGQPVAGVRPTAVGLPRIGASGSFGASELAGKLTAYHDSGRYESDLRTVDTAAQDFIDASLAGTPAQRSCTDRYTRVKRKKGRSALYKRRRACTTTAGQPKPAKPAIVLDIDETSLSNYSGLLTAGFTAGGVALTSASGTGTAIAPTLALFRHAREAGVAVFFVTGRPEAIDGPTQSNLKAVGYDGWQRIDYKPSGMGTEQFKSAARAKIESEGYTILANVGDQESDLDGGHAAKAFKLPNPFYFIAN